MCRNSPFTSFPPRSDSPSPPTRRPATTPTSHRMRGTSSQPPMGFGWVAIGADVSTFHQAATVADPTRLRQILLNLLSNAVKFTHQGEVLVSLDARALDRVPQPEDDQPDWYELHFAVRDTGIGIPPDRIDRLFQSFSQVDASTSRKYGGTGLGLAISKRLAELMGGTMWVESEPGKGSVFHFTLRAQAVDGAQPTYLAADQPELRGKRLLVVDDNATNRLILCRQAESWGMVPVLAASGAEALSIVQRGEPLDLAILGMHMPEMDGLRLADEIRRCRDAEQLPLIMLSSLALPDADPRWQHFAARLTKPIKASQLFDALVGVLSPAPRAAGRGAQAEQPASGLDPELGQRLPLRILLAEDNAVNQKVALHILERMGYRADVAGNGLEALVALERQPYDVVLMAVQMPEMDGLEASRQICARWPEDVRPRIVAMTANAMQSDREACLAAGMHDYLSKPIRAQELQAALPRWGQWVRDRKSSAGGRGAGSESWQLAVGSRGSGDGLSTLDSRLPTPTDAPALDPSILVSMLGTGSGGREVLKELVDLFLAEAVSALAAVEQAVAEGDPEQLRRSAHLLKGMCANLGAEPMAAVSADVEQLGRAGTTTGAALLVAHLRLEFERLRAALDVLLAGHH
ncbi:MAG: response regulator [Chloroflexi bacterium]|nr:response regulator [Chloroflexota bacterium]